MDPEKTADAAAQWWMEQLQAEARAWSDDPLGDVPADNLERFKTALRELLLACYNTRGLFDWLSVDYHPDATLQAALAAADIEASIAVLPWKTVMRFDEDGVRVKRDYSAPWVPLPVADLSEEKP